MNVVKHSQASLYPRKVDTLEMLFTLRGLGNRLFYRWVKKDWLGCLPKLSERTRLFHLLNFRRRHIERLLAKPAVSGVIDSHDVELIFAKDYDNDCLIAHFVHQHDSLQIRSKMAKYKDKSQLLKQLDALLKLPHETECVEFKEAKNDYDFEKLGKYFSALSNEASLKQRECGWLLFGVIDNRSVCGSGYRKDPAKLDRLKQEIANHTNNLTFDEIYSVDHPNGRVIMFKIPPALQRVPTAWKGHWYGRNGESLVPLSQGKLQTIMSGSSTLTVVDKFKKNLLEYDQWQYDGIDKAVYLSDPDYTIKIGDAPTQYGTGNYWWGNLFHEKPKVHTYSFRCKREEVCSVLVIYFSNECLQIPYPFVKNVIDPKDLQSGDLKIDFYCDVFYYDQDSIEYILFHHIRATETNKHCRRFSSPITSQIKPPIIKLPFILLENDVELQSLIDKIKERMAKFIIKYEAVIGSVESDDERKRMSAERLFSEWVHGLWKETRK